MEIIYDLMMWCFYGLIISVVFYHIKYEQSEITRSKIEEVLNEINDKE